MYPQAETFEGRLDCLDPRQLSIQITSRRSCFVLREKRCADFSFRGFTLVCNPLHPDACGCAGVDGIIGPGDRLRFAMGTNVKRRENDEQHAVDTHHAIERRRHEHPAEAQGRRVQTLLTTHEVQEALEERIGKGLYALGQRLPPLRSIAAELGTSPSTVSRAVQEMIHGWLEVQERQFVRVRNQLPYKPVRHAEIQRAIRSIAHKWKLWGGDREELLADIQETVAE